MFEGVGMTTYRRTCQHLGLLQTGGNALKTVAHRDEQLVGPDDIVKTSFYLTKIFNEVVES